MARRNPRITFRSGSNWCSDPLVIDKLEFFIAVAREESFSRAAETCGVTQPTLSAGIKQLEEMLGVLLVNRSSRFHGLTAEGERVLEWAKRIVGDARAMRQDVRSLKSGLIGHLKIAAMPTALTMVAALTTPFRAKHPGVRFSVMSMTSIQILEALDNLEIDAGITYLDNEPLGTVRSLPLYDEQYRLLTSAGSPFSERESVTWAEVGQHSALSADPRHAESPDHQQSFNERRQSAGLDARIKFCDRPLRPCEAPGNGPASWPRSWSILWRSSIRSDLSPSLNRKPCIRSASSCRGEIQ